MPSSIKVIAILAEQNGSEMLSSRSQARDVLKKVSGHRTVLLNFAGVERIGPPFADEVFRIFAGTHRRIEIKVVNACDEVMELVSLARQKKLAGETVPVKESKKENPPDFAFPLSKDADQRCGEEARQVCSTNITPFPRTYKNDPYRPEKWMIELSRAMVYPH